MLVHLHSRRVPGRARCSETEAWTGVHQYQSGWRRTESKCWCVQMSAVVAVGLNSPRFAMLKGIVWSAWPMRCLDTTGGPTPSLSRMSVWLNDTGNCDMINQRAVVFTLSDVLQTSWTSLTGGFTLASAHSSESN